MSEEFRYETMTWVVSSHNDAKRMARDIDKRFNAGWKPTTNGACLAVPLTSEHYLGPKSWMVMMVFAQEKLRDKHVN